MIKKNIILFFTFPNLTFFRKRRSWSYISCFWCPQCESNTQPSFFLPFFLPFFFCTLLRAPLCTLWYQKLLKINKFDFKVYPVMTVLPLSTGSYLVVGESNKFKLTDSIIRSFYNRENKIL